MQRIAGQDRGQFLEGAVERRLAAPQIVIVHARQIVVDQRVDVDAFDRERDPHRPFAIDLEQVAGGDDQHRPDPLAAADRGVAHRLVEPGARVGGDFEQGIEGAVDAGADLIERGPEGHSPPKGAVPLGAPSRPNWICSIFACAAWRRASHCCLSRSPSP